MPRLAHLLSQFATFRSSRRSHLDLAAPSDRQLAHRNHQQETVHASSRAMAPIRGAGGSDAASNVVAMPAIWRRRAVRVYKGRSRVVLVGRIDAVCRMIDRYIAEEDAGRLVPYRP